VWAVVQGDMQVGFGVARGLTMLPLGCALLFAGLGLSGRAALLNVPRLAGAREVLWPRRFALLLFPAIIMAMVSGSLYWFPAPWWTAGWTWAMVAAAASLTAALAAGAPRLAADLAALILLVVGVYGVARTGYLIEHPDECGDWLGFGSTVPVILALGAQAVALGGFGAWLVPRTIGAHLRAPDAELTRRVQRLTETRALAVGSAAAELRRIERDLHDGAQARLVALGMNLRAVERLIETDPQGAARLAAAAREDSAKALEELRTLVRGMVPPVLADRGLTDAVRALALDTPLHTGVDVILPGRPDLLVESACYFAVAEALANAAKHGGARMVLIRMRHEGRCCGSR
jgi:signal transduction histidine kinase